MIRRGTVPAFMLAAASLTPQSCREMQDRLPGIVGASSAHRAIATLTRAGLLHVVRSSATGNPLPGLYTLTAEGEAELNRLLGGGAPVITLPFPPSVNRMWRSVRGRNILSAAGREYRENGLRVVSAQSPRRWPAEVRLSVSISVYPPDRRRRDLDNMPKAVLDLLTHAGVYVDDSQIDRLEIVRRENHPGGRVTVELRAL